MNELRQVFANPWAILLLIPLAALGVLALLAARRQRQALALLGRLPAVRLLVPHPGSSRVLPAICLALGLIFIGTGITGPQWGHDTEQSSRPGRDVVVVLDASWSMFAETPSRFTRARDALIDLSSALRKRGGHRLGLVVFAGRARTICPLTHDYDYFQEIVEQLDPNHPPANLAPSKNAPSGTRMGEALTLAVHTHGADPSLRGTQDILLLSDGDDPAHDEEWNAGVTEARERGIPVYTVGVGDPLKASPILLKPDVSSAAPPEERFFYQDGQQVLTRLDEKPLKEIARLTDGGFFPALARTPPLTELFRQRIESRPGHEGDNVSLPKQRYPWFFAPGFMLLSISMLLSGLRLPRNHDAGDHPRERGTWIQGDKVTGRQGDKVTGRQGDKVTGRQGDKVTNQGRSDHPPCHPVTLSPCHPVTLSRCLLVLLSLALVSAAPVSMPEALVRLGNAAFGQKDYDAAVNFFEAAEARTADPGLVAFNKAAALYRLGHYAEAERHYRMCLEDAEGPRKAQALYGRGNSLVRLSEGRDARTLQEAVACYNQCLKLKDTDESLTENARHNLKMAELLLEQARSARGPDANQPDKGNGPEKPNEQPGANPTPGDPTRDKRQGNAQRVPYQPAPGQKPVEGGDEHDPGKGSYAVISDKAELVHMSTEDAAAHLRQAAERILYEHGQQRSAKAPVSGVRDW